MIVYNNKKGFSILEIIVALFVIAMGMIGVLSLIVQNVQAQYINKNSLVASQLAQEGLELVRNKRDKNWLNGQVWDSGLLGSYRIDYTGTITNVSLASARLNKSQEGYYWHDEDGSDPNTIFSRLITASRLDASADKLKVSCLIQWEERGQTHQYIADTVLYNWR